MQNSSDAPSRDGLADAEMNLMERVKAAVAAYNAMDPIDRALHDADQRRSFVRGQSGRRDPGPDVLADEVRRLRGALKVAHETARLPIPDTPATEQQLDLALLERTLLMCEAGGGHQPGAVTVTTDTFRALLAKAKSAATEQVIAELCDALEADEQVFCTYAELDAAKGTPEGREKAETNWRHAERIRAALTKAQAQGAAR